MKDAERQERDFLLVRIAWESSREAEQFARESGNTAESVAARAHDIVVDELLRNDLKPERFTINVTVVGVDAVDVSVVEKDAVTLLGEQA